MLAFYISFGAYLVMAAVLIGFPADAGLLIAEFLLSCVSGTCYISIVSLYSLLFYRFVFYSDDSLPNAKFY